MDNKEIVINIPEGYEIDKEQSTFEKIVFKRKQLTTYSDICKKIFRTGLYYIGVNGTIIKADNIECIIKNYPEILEHPNNAPTEGQLEQLLAINKLMNVAVYLNEGWKPNWDNGTQFKYFIYCDTNYTTIRIHHNTYFNCGVVYFKSKELAEQAIEILGEETIKLALGVD